MRKNLVFLFLLSCAVLGVAVSQTAPTYPDARASDPIKLGWMTGSPPAADKIIRFDDGSFLRFPQWRWSFSHWRELVPTVNVPRGAGPAQTLSTEEGIDLDAVSFIPLGGGRPMTWGQSLEANYVDGIVVLRKGRIVYERYFGALTPERQHMAFSVTKSFFGLIAATLIHEGKLDANAPVARYIAELKDGGFGDATIAQLLDMTTGLKFSETYGDPNSDFAGYAYAAGFLPRPPGYAGPASIYAYLAGVRKEGGHGQAFTYRSINTDVLGWVIARVTGKSPAEVLRERVWSRLGAEDDAFLQVDPAGTAFAAGGLNLRLRDLARFGEMVRKDGRYNGRQIFPAAVVEDIRRGGSQEAFAKAGYKTLPGWSYHNQWWISHNDHGAYTARGIHGQGIYIDPKAEMTIARFASHPLAGNVNLDPASLPAYEAVARHLLANPR